MPPAAHLGVPVDEIFADLFRQIAEPHYQRAWFSGMTTHFEVANQVLPTRPHQSFWGLNTNFLISHRDGRIKQLGILVVEINDSEKPFWYADKIHDCFDRYHEVLGTSLEVLVRPSAADSMEQLVRSVEALDARLAVMSAWFRKSRFLFRSM